MHQKDRFVKESFLKPFGRKPAAVMSEDKALKNLGTLRTKSSCGSRDRSLLFQSDEIEVEVPPSWQVPAGCSRAY